MPTTIPTPEGATCTVRTSIEGRCGAPAVTSFVSRSGDVLHECADHDLSHVSPGGVKIGQEVTVVHIGVTKVGVVTALQGSRVLVRVPVGRGRTASTKVISRPVAEIGVRP